MIYNYNVKLWKMLIVVLFLLDKDQRKKDLENQKEIKKGKRKLSEKERKIKNFSGKRKEVGKERKIMKEIKFIIIVIFLKDFEKIGVDFRGVGIFIGY